MRSELRALLEREGVTASELAGVETNRDGVALLLAHAILPGDRCYSVADVAAAAGVEAALARRFWRALGFPDAGDEKVFTELDVMALKGAIERAVNEESIERAVNQARGMAAAMAIASEVWSDALVLTARRGLDEGLAPEDLAVMLKDTLDIDRLSGLLNYVHRRLLIAAIQRRLAWITESASAGEPTVTVGFGDMTGYTALVQNLSGDELAVLVDRFEAVTRDLIAASGGRVVKTIGDEVLWVAPTSIAGVSIALDLIDAVARDDVLPSIKAAVDTGPVLMRDGDVFGPTVNRASRIVDLAHAGTVVVTTEVREEVADDRHFTVRPLGPRRLKDIGLTWLWGVGRAGK